MASDGFCAWATEFTKMHLTLPTNSQWTHASTDQYGSRFPWGNDFDRSKLWCSGEVHRDSGGTAAVDRTNHIYVNSYGLTDVLGNVWEWCLDQYTDEEIGWTGSPRFSNPRVIRGSGWHTPSYKPSGAPLPGLRKVRADGDKYRDTIGFRLISLQDEHQS
jgi:formylglycine-generating enzyme required for sulfatase activity